MRRLSPLIAAAALACTGDVEALPAGAARGAATAAAAPAVVDSFVPGYRPDDPAMAALARFLGSSVAGSGPGPEVLADLLDCGLTAEADLPAELLADFTITGRSGADDTVVVRARVLTVAEQDRARPPRAREARPAAAARPFRATERLREGEWEWDVVRGDDGRWRVCAGPRFGLVAPDSLTTWSPDGASSATAISRAGALRGRLGGAGRLQSPE